MWKFNFSDKIKWKFFQAVAMSVLLYNSTTWTLKKHFEKKLDGNYTRILCTVLNKFWKQHPIKQWLYGHLPLISQTIKVRWTKHAEHCWRIRNKLISEVLLWGPNTWTHKCYPSSKVLDLSDLCRLWTPSWGPIKNDGQ